jgi:ATP-dependent exoDNAse (exonuclease V) beta subunit
VGSFLHLLWPVLEPQFNAALAPARPAAVDAAWQTPASGIRRLPGGWEPPAPATGVAAIAAARPRAADLAPPPYDWAGEPARRIGIVVHRALQRIAEEGLEAWDDARLAAADAVLAAELRSAGLPARLVPAAAARALRALRRTLADPRGRWILRSRPNAQCEFAVTGRYAGQVVDAVIDRSFVDDDGVRWIVDYKSSRHEGGALAAFLDTELERHAPQLALYAALMRGLDPRPVRAGLYFPMLTEWREWRAPSGAPEGSSDRPA